MDNTYPYVESMEAEEGGVSTGQWPQYMDAYSAAQYHHMHGASKPQLQQHAQASNNTGSQPATNMSSGQDPPNFFPQAVNGQQSYASMYGDAAAYNDAYYQNGQHCMPQAYQYYNNGQQHSVESTPVITSVESGEAVKSQKHAQQNGNYASQNASKKNENSYNNTNQNEKEEDLPDIQNGCLPKSEAKPEKSKNYKDGSGLMERGALKEFKAQYVQDVCKVQKLLTMSFEDAAKDEAEEKETEEKSDINPLFAHWKPIGYMDSPYKRKSGTPRQGCLVQESTGVIRVLDALYSNPQHSLDGLAEYSHVWLVWVFDQNAGAPYSKAKVSPPRLGGRRVGVFASRSPHRPCPVGLTLARLDAVRGSSVHVSGIDILYGTPILDIKPYIPEYDAPSIPPTITRTEFMKEVVASSTPHMPKPKLGEVSQSHDESFVADESTIKPPCNGIVKKKVKINPEKYKELLSEKEESPRLTTTQQLENLRALDSENLVNVSQENGSAVRTAEWLGERTRDIKVIFNPIAEQQLLQFSPDAEDPRYRLSHCRSAASLRSLVAQGLRSDPRSAYRRAKCADVLHHVTADVATVRCVFLDDDSVEVLRVVPSQ